MFGLLILLAVLVLVVVNYRVNREEQMVYRKRVAPPKTGYSIKDHPSVCAASALRTKDVKTANGRPGSSGNEANDSDK